MQLPSNFKNTIAKTFYDKEVNRIGETQIIEADGAVKRNFDNVTGSFMGNVRLTNFKTIQKEYGLDYQIDVAITCDPSVILAADDVIEYMSTRYVVTDVLPFDSHKLIVGTKWQTQR